MKHNTFLSLLAATLQKQTTR